MRTVIFLSILLMLIGCISKKVAKDEGANILSEKNVNIGTSKNPIWVTERTIKGKLPYSDINIKNVGTPEKPVCEKTIEK